jgi:hypothetical protein
MGQQAPPVKRAEIQARSFARPGRLLTSGTSVNWQSRRRLCTAREGEELEIDLLLVNGAAAIVVEMQAAFKVGDVNDRVEDWGRFREFFPKYREPTWYGAVAAGR